MQSRIIIEKIAFGAVLASISIVLKLFVTIETEFFQISLFDFPLLLSGIILGPFAALVGLTEDIVYFMIDIRGLAVGFNLMTVSAILLGLIPGLFFMLFKYNKKRLLFIISLSLTISFILSTIQLYIYTGPSILTYLPYRIGILIIKIPFETYLINLFLTDKRFAIFKFFKGFAK